MNAENGELVSASERWSTSREPDALLGGAVRDGMGHL